MKDWLDTKELAEHLGNTRGAASNLIKKYQAQLEKHLRFETFPRKKIFISKEGVVVLATLRGGSGRPMELTSIITKQHIAEKAIEAVTPSDDPLIAQLQMSIGLLFTRRTRSRVLGSIYLLGLSYESMRKYYFNSKQISKEQWRQLYTERADADVILRT